MARKKSKSRATTAESRIDIEKVSVRTERKELVWLGGKRQEIDVYRIPIKHLYFNIENGRYADKMIQLKADNPGVEIDPRETKWRNSIWQMLKGEYKGTEADKEAFTRLRADILARQQLRPGVALSDGGVLDGNRRLAVLLDLHANEANPTRHEYFDGVILPEETSEDDRWRIEAGLQIGRDERLDYSPINRLLKIKQGLEIFSGNGKPADEIANTLVGISKVEVEKDIAKIRLIDEYLAFISKPSGYHLVTGLVERFEEALNALEAAKKAKWAPDKVAALKTKLFSIIRFELMTNWEMRDIWRAMGVTGKGKSGRYKNDRVLTDFLKTDETVARVKTALEKRDRQFEKSEKDKSEAFLDQS